MKLPPPINPRPIDAQYFILAKAMLVAEEGIDHFPYRDTEGILTIGIGHNLEANGISDRIVEELFREDLQRAIEGCERVFPDLYYKWDMPRQLAVLNMVFQMGTGKPGGTKGLFGFRNTIKAMRAGDWNKAADLAAQSLWAKQTPNRAARVLKMMRENRYVYT